jgi:hypothetical protein
MHHSRMARGEKTPDNEWQGLDHSPVACTSGRQAALNCVGGWRGPCVDSDRGGLCDITIGSCT